MRDLAARRMAAALAVCMLAAPAAAAPRVVKVVDEANRGVESAILVNEGADEWRHLSYTGTDGSAVLEVECRPGSRLKARPGNSGRYYDSRPQDCAVQKPLRVISKFAMGAAAGELMLNRLNLADGRTWFMLVQPRLAAQRKETFYGGGLACSISISVAFDRRLYEEAADGSWRAVNIAEEAPRLIRPPGSPELASAVAPSSCAAADEELRLAEQAALPQVSEATSIAASWQTYRIAKDNVIESVEIGTIPYSMTAQKD